MAALYLTYNGLTEPLGRRQVIPYLLGLAARGWRYTVISFEKHEAADPGAIRQVEGELAAGEIEWLPLRYHRWPSLPATGYDVLRGVAAGVSRGRGARLIHARSTVPAVMAVTLSKILRIPWIYDVRGLLAQEYLDAGHWGETSLAYRLTNAAERRLLKKAHGLVFLTHTIQELLRSDSTIPGETPTTVVPCCVDHRVFKPSGDARRRVREELGLGDGALLVYCGSLGSWYLLPEMMTFFEYAREEIPGLRFLVLTPHVEIAEKEASRRGLQPDVVAKTLRPAEVPNYLAAGDAGICFLSNCPSKRASSPTKYGEYLAAGLPIVTDAWTGDAALFAGTPIWIQVGRFEETEYRKAARQLKDLLSKGAATTQSARSFASSEFSLGSAIEKYDALYRGVTAEHVKRCHHAEVFLP